MNKEELREDNNLVETKKNVIKHLLNNQESIPIEFAKIEYKDLLNMI